jgi:Ca2+-binding RTX toxin-like protein
MFQGATHAPDAVHRWMGSAALNGAGDMAVGYSVSDATSVFPGIRYAGRLSTDPINTLPQGEFTMVNGASSSGATRWGDYSAMAVDPVDDCTFWYTAEYMAAAGRRTRVGAFKFPSCVRTISIGDVSQNEGNAGTTAFTFTLSLSAPTGVVTTVNFATADGSATTADNDYQGTAGTVVFPSGDTSETVTVLVNGDNKFEPNENFFVNLSNPMGADIADGQGEGTIVNDDPQPTISIDDVSDFEGHFGQNPFTFTVSLSNPSYQTITVDYDTSDGTATVADNDYQPASGTVVFLTGDTSEEVTVQVNGDVTIEPDENFFVDLSNPVNATITDPQGEGTILNDDLSADVDCTITGTNRDDVLVGTPGNDVICGRAGDDRIFGAGGHDVLFGDPGRDLLFGEAGNDLLLSGPGQGFLDGGAGNDNLQGEQGKDDLTGGSGSDALFGGNSPDSLDTMDGVAANDRADGGRAPDTCVSDPGDLVIDCP